MPIAVKMSIAKPKTKTKPVSAVDMEKLITALNKNGSWAKYTVVPTATPKYDKEKKVIEISIKAAPSVTKPKWNEYGKTTKNRQAEWDRMFKALEKYVTNLHSFFLEAVAKFESEVKSEELDKAKFTKLWKTKKAAFQKVLDDYASKTTNGQTLGVKLDLIDPDPVAVKSDIKKPKTSHYTVSGKSIEAVFNVLNKRKFWGRYRSFESRTMDYALDGMLDDITVKAKPSITMPKWGNYSKANAKQKAEWDKMYGILLKHENNHHAYFLECVAKFLDDIQDKKLTKAEATKHWVDSVSDWQDTQDAYDSRSDHGINEGVSLDFNADPEPEEKK